MEQIHIWRLATLFMGASIIGMVVLQYREGDTSLVDPTTAITPSSINFDSTNLNNGQPETGLFSTQVDLSTQTDDDNSNEHWLQLGERLLERGNNSLALESFRRFRTNQSEPPSNIAIRMAICQELSQQWGPAKENYRSVVSNSSDTNEVGLAVAGYSRVLVAEGQTHEAIELLSQHRLRENSQLSAGTAAHLAFQWAKVLEENALRRSQEVASESQRPPTSNQSQSIVDARIDNDSVVSNELISPESIAIEPHRAKVEELLNILRVETESVNAKEQAQDGIQLLQMPTSQADTILLSVSTPLEPLSVIFGKLTELIETPIQVSEQAKSAIAGRSRDISLPATTLSSLLDQLLLPHKLVWIQDNFGIQILREDEIEIPQARKIINVNIARRAFRQFEIDFPEHQRRKSSLLSRAGLAHSIDQLDEAANLYQELEQIHPEGEIQAILFFNLAKLNLAFRRNDTAKTLLYKSIDQTLDDNIVSSSYCLLGKIHLSAGELEDSIICSRRALSKSPSEIQTQTAAIYLTRAFLLNRDPFAANEAVFRYKKSLAAAADTRILASIHGAYARSLGLSDQSGQMTAQARLLGAISMVKPEQLSSFADCYIAAQAYRSLGFRERSSELLLLALSRSDLGIWQREVTFALGVNQQQSGDFENAIATFTGLTTDRDKWELFSLEKLASLYFEQGDTNRCLETCMQLWTLSSDDELKKTTLTIMGKALQQQGKHHSAATCFAGMVPDEF